MQELHATTTSLKHLQKQYTLLEAHFHELELKSLTARTEPETPEHENLPPLSTDSMNPHSAYSTSSREITPLSSASVSFIHSQHSTRSVHSAQTHLHLPSLQTPQHFIYFFLNSLIYSEFSFSFCTFLTRFFIGGFIPFKHISLLFLLFCY